MPSSSNLSLGVGRLFWAPVGTAEPTDYVTALPAAYTEIGYTTEGSEISFSTSSDPVEVAEEFDPLFNRTTSRTGTVSFSMAENTVRNVVLAFNGGTVTATGTGATAGFAYEPPAVGAEVRRMLVWQAENGSERWLLRRVYQTGDVTIARRKGAEYASIPAQFSVEAPGNNVQPFKVFYAASRAGGYTV